MDFNDTPEQAAFRAEARGWLANNQPDGWPLETGYAEDLTPFKNWQARKADAGWACLTWPGEYGGRGASMAEQIIWKQEEGELQFLSAPFIIGHGMAGQTIMAHGTDQQKQRYLPPMIRGDEIWCQLFSEPAAGSDLAGLRTRAVRDGDDWIINGQKIWTSFGHIADHAILVTRTNPDAPKHKGLTYFILDMKAPGVEVRPIKQASGESDFNEVFMTDVRLPDSARVDAVGAGWRVAMTTLMNERLSVGAAFPTNFDDMLELTSKIETGQGAAINDGAVRDRMADWYVRASGLKYTGLRMMTALSRGEAPGPEASITKLVLGAGRQDLASTALDLMDVAGVVDGPDADSELFHKMFFRSIGNRLEGGTDEILRNIIGERVLGLPSDIRIDKSVAFSEIPTGG